MANLATVVKSLLVHHWTVPKRPLQLPLPYRRPVPQPLLR